MRPWTILSESERAGPERSAGYLSLLTRRYRLPSGQEADWDVLDCRDGVEVVAVTTENTVLLVRQYRPGPGLVLDELPGGYIEPGEEPADAARRELLEETGYVGDLRVVGQTWLAGFATARRFAAVATGCRPVAAPRHDAEEFAEVIEVSIPAFVEHVVGGQLTDAGAAMLSMVELGMMTSRPPLSAREVREG